MSKYEIMLIIDPKAEIDKTNKLLKEVFGEELTSFEKMERTELAYPIKHSLQAQYALAYVSTSKTALIKEFRRKSSLSKDIWRNMIINVTSEVGLGKVSKKKLVKHYEKTERKNDHYEKSEKRNNDGYVKSERKYEDREKSDKKYSKFESSDKKPSSPRKHINKGKSE